MTVARRLKYPNPSGGLGALDAEPGSSRSSRPSRRRPRPNPQALALATGLAEERVARFMDGDKRAFLGIDATQLLGLYAHLHAQVYGVEPGDLAQDWALAVAAAKKMLDVEFNSDGARMVGYVRWAWVRENGRERARRRSGDAGDWRLGWRLMFRSNGLLTDYRVHCARRQSGVRS
jgi:hypothetical protein